MKLSVLASVKTNNFNDPEITKKVGGAWAEALGGKQDISQGVYAVYHNYESNFTGDYTLSICVEGEIKGKEIIEIADDTDYKVFLASDSEIGVYSKWQEIWQLEKSGEINRAYTHDYEFHTKTGEVKIHISVK